MILNYLKTAWRNIRKQKGYSVINLSGLAIGMACCLLILLFVQDELSYDRYHENAERIYRVVIDAEIGGSLSQLALCPFAAPPAFAEEIPEVEAYVRLVGIGRRQIIEYQEQSFEEEGIFLADETFFDIWTDIRTISWMNPVPWSSHRIRPSACSETRMLWVKP